MLDHQQSNPNIVKEKRKNQDSKVNVRKQLGRNVICELYNQKLKKILYYH
jgi:hypothetical protein